MLSVQCAERDRVVLSVVLPHDQSSLALSKACAAHMSHSSQGQCPTGSAGTWVCADRHAQCVQGPANLPLVRTWVPLPVCEQLNPHTMQRAVVQSQHQELAARRTHLHSSKLGSWLWNTVLYMLQKSSKRSWVLYWWRWGKCAVARAACRSCALVRQSAGSRESDGLELGGVSSPLVVLALGLSSPALSSLLGSLSGRL